jgi:hypothetical protein
MMLPPVERVRKKGTYPLLNGLDETVRFIPPRQEVNDVKGRQARVGAELAINQVDNGTLKGRRGTPSRGAAGWALRPRMRFCFPRGVIPHSPVKFGVKLSCPSPLVKEKMKKYLSGPFSRPATPMRSCGCKLLKSSGASEGRLPDQKRSRQPVFHDR